MSADRPGARTSSVPRLCSAQIAAAMGVALTVAALGSARAQSPDPATVFRPLDGDPRNPGRFRRVDPRRQSRAPATDLDPFAPIGLRAGAFTLFPAIELTGGIDTNPSHVPGGRESSLLIVAPELKVRSDWQRHALNADIKGTYTAYGEKFGFKDDGSMTGVPNSLDRPSLDARANGRLDITSRNRLDVEGRLLVGTDNPGSPNIQAGLARLPIVTT